MNYWLMKSEPDTFSWDDLCRSPQQTSHWNGVRNYQARNFMRDDFKVGDKIFFYHSSCDIPAIVGLADVVKEAYPDHTASDSTSEYFDERSSKKGQNPWVMVDVKAVSSFGKPITLSKIRGEKSLQTMLLIRPGQRLSIQPVSRLEAEQILKMACWNPINN